MKFICQKNKRQKCQCTKIYDKMAKMINYSNWSETKIQDQSKWTYKTNLIIVLPM